MKKEEDGGRDLSEPAAATNHTRALNPTWGTNSGSDRDGDITRRRDAWRRSQLPHDMRAMRRERVELAERCGVLRPRYESSTDGDWYARSGLTLGMPERVAAGREMRKAAA